ncbi:MAG: efflux transporter periplasmic adaptor subunit, partial [Nitrospiria bacterium]
VQQQPEGMVVYVMEGNRAVKKPVRLGKALGDRVLIREGIEAGSKVILMSQRRLVPGDAVEAIK